MISFFLLSSLMNIHTIRLTAIIDETGMCKKYSIVQFLQQR